MPWIFQNNLMLHLYAQCRWTGGEGQGKGERGAGGDGNRELGVDQHADPKL